ncbi:hypothetical protein [Pseudomonas sp. Marseille-P9899]|uniref:hypothetical protein n=1 Tax=Pseudomonas sp. Marseille-P9899 TaxID=2730401 RepID=UPI00158B2A7A|nr:hypothetical protein [Pseudomonas sp. Marseille-P9899]
MNIFNPLTTAQQVRSDYRRKLMDSRNEIAAPTVPDIIPGDPDGLILASVLANPLKVTIPTWRVGPFPPGFSETLTLRWAQQGTGQYLTILEQTVPRDAIFPLELFIPVENFIEGRRLLGYEVSTWDNSDLVSQDLPLRLDTTPPYDLESPVALTLEAAVITDAWLDENQGELLATITAYADKEPGDSAFLFWLREVPDDVGDIPIDGMIELDTVMDFKLTREFLAAAGDGDWYALYIIRDRAGNLSRVSYPTKVSVALGALPSNLQDPVVPLALGDGIDRDDAFLGVVVEIPQFDGGKNGDLIQVKWGTTALEEYPLGPSPSFPLTVQVPWSVMRDLYDFNTGGAQPVVVSYEVKRGSLSFPGAPLTTEFQVNFEVVGPENPAAPDPVNPSLPAVVVRGESGQDNKLIQSDNGNDATAYIPLYDSAKAGDMIWLYWNGVRIPEFYDVKPGDVPGDIVEMTIPWAWIEQTGNRTDLPVHYLITDLAEVNHQKSAVTRVEVLVEVISFPAPTFPHIYSGVDGLKVLNCSSIRSHNGEHGFFVHIAPDGKYLKAGVEVTLDWWVTEWLEDGEGGIVPNTEFTAQVILDASHEANGVDIFVQPYETRILPAYTQTTNGVGLSSAHFRLIAGGELVASQTAVEYIGVNLQCPMP